MLTQEKFYEIEMEHGCGYWNLCWEHACPCAIVTENKGLQEKIYNDFTEENKELAKEYELLEYEPLVKCCKCGCVENESDLIDGMCFECYEDYEEELEDDGYYDEE